jgi:outer membrane protein OmpA-like peptidoglycan-associated protein
MKTKLAVLFCIAAFAAGCGSSGGKVNQKEILNVRNTDAFTIKDDVYDLTILPEPVIEVSSIKPAFTISEEYGAAFDYGKATIKPSYQKELDVIAARIKRMSNIKVRTEGHTDSSGSAEFNQELSEQRAKSVRDYLVVKGVSASIISYKGYGKTRPTASNSTSEGRAKNRRVDIYVESI